MLGQKNLTFFPVAESFFLHRFPGFSETHVSQFLTCFLLKRKECLLLKRKMLLSSHSPRLSDCKVVGNADAVGGLYLHLRLQMLGQKNLTFFPVVESYFLHRFSGFSETHVSQFLICFLLKRKVFFLMKRKVLLSSHSPRSSSDCKVVGNGNTVGGLYLHLVLQMLGQKYLTNFHVTGSFRLHLLIGFVETHVLQSFSFLLLNRNVLLSSHSPLLLLVGEVAGNADNEGKSVGVLMVSNRIGADVGESDGLPVGFFVGVRVGKYVGEIMGDRVLVSLLLPFPLLLLVPSPLLFSLLLLFESFSKPFFL
jgi:hypothetical protein